MTDVSRSCARCRDIAVVTRGNAAYCMKCNEVLDWAEVIALVQTSQEPVAFSSVDEASVAAAIAHDDAVAAGSAPGKSEVVSPAYSAPGGDGDADPFSVRL